MSTRQIILDTETTGLATEDGHRIIEIGCIEVVNRRLTNRHFHVYLNPGREVDAGAVSVHGITTEFLQDKPKFADVIEEFLAFVKEAELIIHNAPFDIGFLNYELSLLNRSNQAITDFCTVIDTLKLARRKHPGQRNSLDALCQRYKVDNTNRELHGALLDAQLLAQVYLLMTGGQAGLFQEESNESGVVNVDKKTRGLDASRKSLPVIKPTEEELESHQNFLAKIRKKSGKCVWD